MCTGAGTVVIAMSNDEMAKIIIKKKTCWYLICTQIDFNHILNQKLNSKLRKTNKRENRRRKFHCVYNFYNPIHMRKMQTWREKTNKEKYTFLLYLKEEEKKRLKMIIIIKIYNHIYTTQGCVLLKNVKLALCNRSRPRVWNRFSCTHFFRLRPATDVIKFYLVVAIIMHSSWEKVYISSFSSRWTTTTTKMMMIIILLLKTVDKEYIKKFFFSICVSGSYLKCGWMMKKESPKDFCAFLSHW